MNDDDLEKLAQQAEDDTDFARRRRGMEDFRYDEQQGAYWDTTTGNLISAKSVNGAIPKDEWPTRPDGRNGQLKPYPPADAINDVDTGLTVEGSTWWPGMPTFIQDIVVTDRGPIKIRGACCYNSYVPPDRSKLRTDQNPDPWIEHVQFLFPDPVEQEQFFNWAAHMVQRPDEKVNHGLVMAGAQGIGKDTALLPLRWGVGEWNTAEIEPDVVNRQYNGYVKSVMLIINEVRPHDEDHKASNFYNQLKPLLASPPEMLAMEIKYANPIYVRNLCHVILTTNDPLSMYIPPEDRRLFVMRSPLPDPKTTPIFSPDYFHQMHDYLADGGSDAVVRWLLNRPLDNWQPAAPPPMTTGKQAIIESAHQVRRTVADDVIEACMETLGSPQVIFARDLSDIVNQGNFFDDRREANKALQARNFHFKMSEWGYEPVRNPDASEWRIKRGKELIFRSRVAFVAKSVPHDEQLRAIAAELQKRPLALEWQ